MLFYNNNNEHLFEQLLNNALLTLYKISINGRYRRNKTAKINAMKKRGKKRERKKKKRKIKKRKI